MATLGMKNAEKAFTEEGFCNWKKAIAWFRDHSISEAHKAAVEQVQLVKQKPIENQLIQQSVAAQKLNF